MTPIKVLIADDHRIFRDGLMSLLEKEVEVEVVADAGDGNEVMSRLESVEVDVILMDIDMGETSGIDTTTKVKAQYPKSEVLAISMHGEKNYILKMLEAGAKGYILKNAGREEMVTAIKTVANGDTYFSNQVSSRLIEQLTQPHKTSKSSKDDPLTDREIEVLKLIVEEYSNPEIAEKLFISIRTVDTHRRNLLEKLGVKNTAGLVKYAIRNGLIE